METAYISAFSGLAGAIIGGLTSFGSTWFTQREQSRNTHRQAERAKLEALYDGFIHEAVRLFASAVSRQAEDPANLVALFALLSRMRLVSDRAVIAVAVRIEEHILETFLAPSLSTEEMRALVHNGAMKTLLAEFGEACRRDLAARAR